MDKETKEIVKRYLGNIRNDVECMHTNENPSMEEMWWNLALGVVERIINQYLESLFEEEE